MRPRVRRLVWPAEAAPDAVVGDDQAARALLAQLGGDPLRAQTGMAKREGDDRLLNQRRELTALA